VGVGRRYVKHVSMEAAIHPVLLVLSAFSTSFKSAESLIRGSNIHIE